MSNEKKDIEAINLLHKEYFRLLSDNKLDQLKDILVYCGFNFIQLINHSSLLFKY